MLVKLLDNKITSFFESSNKDLEDEFLKNNNGYIKIDFDFVEDLDYYLYDEKNKTFVLIEKFEELKEQKRLAEVEPEPIPKVITMRQARLQLLELGLLDDVEALVSLDRKSQIEWEYANEVYRQSLLIELVKEAISLTDEQIDDMFLSASKL